MRIAVVGGGWAGLAAAVKAVKLQHTVTLFEMAPTLGGRARTVQAHGRQRDNGQHVLVGAYHQTLNLMRELGVAPDRVLHRMPLNLTRPDGTGLALKTTSSPVAFAMAVLGHGGWRWASRMALLRASAGWALSGFDSGAERTVAELTDELPREVREGLIDPLCVAALNTPPSRASARVFLRVLKDALYMGRGGADLLLPRQPLGDLLPEPARIWLQGRGARISERHRVTCLTREGTRWRVADGEFDGVILACSAKEAARLTMDHDPRWSGLAERVPHESITTAYLRCEGARLRSPMTFLEGGPAQFVFDLQAMGHPHGGFAFVISAADEFLSLGREELAGRVLQQAMHQFPVRTWPLMPVVEAVFTEHRATFRCEPGVARPIARIADGLWAAGDYVEGPYPATLEGAVRSGNLATEGMVKTASAMQNRDSNRGI